MVYTNGDYEIREAETGAEDIVVPGVPTICEGASGYGVVDWGGEGVVEGGMNGVERGLRILRRGIIYWMCEVINCVWRDHSSRTSK